MSDRRLRNRSRAASFLCYHSIAPEGPAYLRVSAEMFERQLALFKRLGLASGSSRELRDLDAGRLRRPTVFLTFDDGYRDNFETALPLLRAHGFTATVFVLPPLLDQGGPFVWPEVAADRERFPGVMRSMTWEMAGEMTEAGIEIGSHTLTHPHLPELSEEDMREQLWDSRQRIIARLGRCETIAYPFGEWSPAVARAAAECGYSFAYSLPTKTGQASAEPHAIPRINVDDRDRDWRLRAKLSPLGKPLFLSPRVAGLRALSRPLRRLLREHSPARDQ